MTEYYRTSDGIKLAYKLLNPSKKDNTPLILIQGTSGCKEDWDYFSLNLSQDRPVLIFDNRGMG